EIHDTPKRRLEMDATRGLGRMNHLVPSQDSINAWSPPPLKYEPTAMQSVAETQETPWRTLSPLPVWSGGGTADHWVPFQASARAWSGKERSRVEPTAVHELAEMQDTPKRLLSPVPTLGLGTIDHAVPF